jgi:hypothetical protein
MAIENNNKTEAIKACLLVLLNTLENKKQMIATKKSYIYIDDKIAPYVPRDELDSLNIGTSTLSNLIKQFKSVDDLNSVKKLRQTELLFFKTDSLSEFKFPDYQSNISPDFLIYADIEIQLDALDKKALELLHRGHTLAGTEASWVVLTLRNLNQWYFQEKKINYFEYKTNVLAVFDEARPILEQHRGCKKILTNLAVLISTLGIAFIVNKCINNRYLFFPETKSSELLTQLEHRVSKLNS